MDTSMAATTLDTNSTVKQPSIDELISITELTKLTDLGISLADITWAKVKLSADQWICVRQPVTRSHDEEASCNNCSSRSSSSNASQKTCNKEPVRFSLSDDEEDSDFHLTSTQSVSQANNSKDCSKLSIKTKLPNFTRPILIPKQNVDQPLNINCCKTKQQNVSSSICSLTNACNCSAINCFICQQENMCMCNELVPSPEVQSRVLNGLVQQSRTINSSNSLPVPVIVVDDGTLSFESIGSLDKHVDSGSVPSSLQSTVSSTSSQTNQQTCLMNGNPNILLEKREQSVPITVKNVVEQVSLSVNNNGFANNGDHVAHVKLPSSVKLNSPSSIEVKQMRAHNRLMVKSNSFNAISRGVATTTVTSPKVLLNSQDKLHKYAAVNSPGKIGTTSSADGVFRNNTIGRIKGSRSSHNLSPKTVNVTADASNISVSNRSDKEHSREPCLQCSTRICVMNPYDARLRFFSGGRVRCAQLNPNRPILATSVGSFVCSINCLRTGKVQRKVQFSQRVLHIQWLSTTILALITTGRVFHWDLSNATNLPQAVFPLHPRLSGSQIVAYETDETMRWCALNTLTHDTENNSIEGLTQIAHLQLNNGEPQYVVQCLNGFCVQFLRLAPEPTCLTENSKSFSQLHRSQSKSESNHLSSKTKDTKKASSTSLSSSSRSTNNVSSDSTETFSSSQSKSQVSSISTDTPNSDETAAVPLSITPSPPPPTLTSLPSDSLFMFLLRRKGSHNLWLYLQEAEQFLRPQHPLTRSSLVRSETLRLNPPQPPPFTPDFPLFAIAATRAGLLYLLSKHSQLLVCDLHTCAQLLPQMTVSRQPLIAARLDLESQGVICVARDGRVLLLEPSLMAMSLYLATQGPKMAVIADRFRLIANATSFDEITRL